MIDIPVFYASHHGHTRRIAEFVASEIWQNGYVSKAVDIKSSRDLDMTRTKAAVVGASLLAGRYPRPLARFIQQHRRLLSRQPTGFFSVSMLAASEDPDIRMDAVKDIDLYLRDATWQPTLRASFAGALTYTQYSWPVRMMMRRLAQRSGDPTDISRDHVFTDWNVVREYARTMVRATEARTGESQKGRGDVGPMRSIR
jgi:menaquinone-dependent protoporphyrinogen oxidase